MYCGQLRECPLNSPEASRVLYIDPMNETILTPILDLFAKLPPHTGEMALIVGLAYGLGALLAIKAPGFRIDPNFIVWPWDKD